MSSRPLFALLSTAMLIFFVTIPARAEKIPDFRLPEVSSGRVIDTSNLRGQVLLVNFWATWCPPCRMELPELNDLYRKYNGRGLTVIGVSVDQASKSRIANFVKTKGISYPVVRGDSSLSRRYGGVNAIPASFLVGRDG